MNPDRAFKKSEAIAHLFDYGIRGDNGVCARVESHNLAVVLCFSERARHEHGHNCEERRLAYFHGNFPGRIYLGRLNYSGA
jgi:hypothetical protein